MKYLVIGSDGPGFSTPEETIEVLEKLILPAFELLLELEAQGKIVAGGLPVGDRAFVFIVEADSHDEVDIMLRKLPAWGLLQWDVRPLQTFSARAEQERGVLAWLRQP